MNSRKLILACALVVAAWFAFFADKTPETAVVEAAPATVKKVQTSEAGSVVRIPAQGAKPANVAPVIASIIDRKTLINSDYKSSQSFFGAQSWTPPPPPAAAPPPPPPPTAPPLPFKYLGKKSDDGQLEVYLSNGDRTYIVQEKTIIDNIYRVDSIKPTAMSLTYLPLNQVQTLQIGSAD